MKLSNWIYFLWNWLVELLMIITLKINCAGPSIILRTYSKWFLKQGKWLNLHMANQKRWSRKKSIPKGQSNGSRAALFALAIRSWTSRSERSPLARSSAFSLQKWSTRRIKICSTGCIGSNTDRKTRTSGDVQAVSSNQPAVAQVPQFVAFLD